MKVEGKKCLGYLKVETRTLFHRDAAGKVSELKPLCLMVCLINLRIFMFMRVANAKELAYCYSKL